MCLLSLQDLPVQEERRDRWEHRVLLESAQEHVLEEVLVRVLTEHKVPQGLPDHQDHKDSQEHKDPLAQEVLKADKGLLVLKEAKDRLDHVGPMAYQAPLEVTAMMERMVTLERWVSQDPQGQLGPMERTEPLG